MAGLSGKTSHLRQSSTKALSRPRRFHFPRPFKTADLPYSLGQATQTPFQIRLFRAIDRSRNRNACSARRRPSRRTGHIDHRKPTRPFSSWFVHRSTCQRAETTFETGFACEIRSRDVAVFYYNRLPVLTRDTFSNPELRRWCWSCSLPGWQPLLPGRPRWLPRRPRLRPLAPHRHRF